MLHVPLESLPALKGRSRAAVRNFSIDPDGSFIYWPDFDVHLGWNQFLQAVDPAELRKARGRSAGFNKRYGAAIRKVREEAGILQSQVEGLTDRQLRRIERGVPCHDCRDHSARKGSRPRPELLYGDADTGECRRHELNPVRRLPVAKKWQPAIVTPLVEHGAIDGAFMAARLGDLPALRGDVALIPKLVTNDSCIGYCARPFPHHILNDDTAIRD